jgi:GT2 family glycosyltransferase
MRIAAVVVHYRTPQRLIDCLPRLAAAGFDEVVVADNASPEGPPPVAGLARLVVAATRGGFGAGANLGIRATSSDAVVVVNPDSLAPAYLRSAIEEGLAAHENAWAAGCRLDTLDGRPQRSGRRFYRPLDVPAARLFPRSARARRNAYDGWDRESDATVDWVPGNGFVIRRWAFERLGGFDERYFQYFEDVDICLRTWEAGGEVWYLAGARLVHDEQRASARGLNRALYWHLRAYARFVRKWGTQAIDPGASILRPR